MKQLRGRPATTGASRVHHVVGVLTALVIGAGVVGCGGGSSGGGFSAAGPTVSGKVVAGIVANATVRVFRVNPDRTLTLVAEGTTDADGSYTLTPTGDGPFLILAGGGTYRDEATGQTRSLPPPPIPTTLDSPRPGALEAIVGAGAGSGPMPVSLTPLSTIASRRVAEASKTDPAALDESSVQQSSEELAAEFGLGPNVDPRSVVPLDFGDPANAGAIAADPDSPEARLGALLAGLSQAAEDLGLSEPLDLVDALAEDFSDGTLNGQAGSQPVTVGGGTLSPTAGTSDLAGATQTFLDDPAVNQSGTDSGSYTALITSVQTQDVAPAGVNKAPSFDPIANRLVAAGAGAQNVTIANLSAGSGESQTLTVTATSSDVAVIATPTITGSGATRTLTFTPATVGTVTITVRAQDDGGTANGGVDTVARTFQVVVGTAPTITSAAPPADALLATAYSHGVTVTGTPAPTLSVSGNPPWLTLSGGALSGTPTAAHVGVTSTVTITATNGIAPVATQTVAITVYASPAITSVAPAQATVGTAYTYTIQTGGFPSPTLQASGLPPWLTLSGNVLSGTPTDGDVGVTGTITITALDNGRGPDATQAFQITVNPRFPAGQWDGSAWDAASWGN